MSSEIRYVLCRLLSQLEAPSWWPFGKAPWKTQHEAKAEDAARAAAAATGSGSGRNKVITSIPALVSSGGGSGAESDLKPGCLLVLVSSLEVRNASGQLLHRFERSEVDDIRVHSPYEVSVRQRFIGKPDIGYRLLSAKMPEALSVLEMQYKKKVEFTSEFSAFNSTPATSPCGAEGSVWDEGKKLWCGFLHTLHYIHRLSIVPSLYYIILYILVRGIINVTTRWQ